MDHESIVRWSLSVGAGLAVWLVGWLIGGLMLRRVARLSHRTATDLDDHLVAAIRPQIPFLTAVLGAMIGAQIAPLGASSHRLAAQGAGALITLSLTFAAAGFLEDLVARKAPSSPEALPVSTLTRRLVRIVVLCFGLMMIATQLGIAITPILTALGVGSLAVALALQPTLANFFAGIHVTLARKIRIGDFVELEGGGKGYVADIGWRSTQIRELPNNLIIVPNAKLAEIVVKNYSLPETEQAALVEVGVAYGSDLRFVERVTLDVAAETLREVAGGVAEFQPLVRYHSFGASAVEFTVVLRVRQFADRYLITHEFIKRLHGRYAREGIEIPFPQRVVHVAPAAGGPGGPIRPGAAREPDDA